MPNIFKKDIAGKINKKLGPLVFDLTLHVVTEGTRGANLTGGTNPTETDHAGRGFVDDYRNTEIDGTIIQIGDRKTVILGASLPAGVVPKVQDKVTIEGTKRTIVFVKRDPAGATYECASRG
jgi:hypothetical protein